jgi:hypothetical protein
VTVLNRYWMSDKSGMGREQWKYFEGDFAGDRAEALDHVISRYESWAQDPEDFRYGLELNVPRPGPISWRNLSLEWDAKGAYRSGRWKLWCTPGEWRWNAAWQCGSTLMMHTEGDTPEAALEACLMGLHKAMDEHSVAIEKALNAVVEMNEASDNARRDICEALLNEKT